MHEVLSTWKKWSNKIIWSVCSQFISHLSVKNLNELIEPKINYYDSDMTKQMLGFLGSISSNHTEIFCTWVLPGGTGYFLWAIAIAYCPFSLTS